MYAFYSSGPFLLSGWRSGTSFLELERPVSIYNDAYFGVPKDVPPTIAHYAFI